MFVATQDILKPAATEKYIFTLQKYVTQNIILLSMRNISNNYLLLSVNNLCREIFDLNYKYRN